MKSVSGFRFIYYALLEPVSRKRVMYLEAQTKTEAFDKKLRFKKVSVMNC